MPELAQGLKMVVNDRDKFNQFIDNNSSDPAVIYERWGANSVPEAMYIVRYDFDDRFYYVINQYVNGVVNSSYLNEDLIEEALESGVLERDGYDVEFVNQNK